MTGRLTGPEVGEQRRRGADLTEQVSARMLGRTPKAFSVTASASRRGTSALSLVIELNREGIGDVALWLTDRKRHVAEIGWVLDPDAAGHGYAREAAAAALHLAFDHYRLHRVVAQMDAKNHASAKLATAIGMKLEGHLRQHWWSKDEWTDTLVFGSLSTDSRPT